MRIWSNSLVLSVDQNPQADLVLRVIEVLSHALLERAVRFVLEHAEAWQFRRWPVPLVKGGEIEALVLGECLVRDDFGSKIQVLLFTFTFLRLHLQALLIEASLLYERQTQSYRFHMNKLLTEVSWRVLVFPWSKNLIDGGFTHVH